MFRTLTIVFLTLFSFSLFAQMPAADGTIRYGNEWIDYDRTYLKIPVAADGMYRITPAQLAGAGLPAGGEWVLEHAGASVPFTAGPEGIIFYGAKNRGDMDRFLFEDPETMQLNDRYSMHADTAVYYLSRGPGGQPYAPANIETEVADRNTFLRTSEMVFSKYQTKNYFRSAGSSIFYTHYDVAEGFGHRSADDLVSLDGRLDTSFVLPLPGATGAAGTLALRFGTAFDGHVVEIKADGTLLTTVSRSSWSVQQHLLPLTPAGAETTISIAGTRGVRDKPNMAWARVTYPAATQWDAGLQRFTIPASRTATRIVLTNLGAAAGAGEVIRGYAPGLGTVVSATVGNDGTATLELPAAGADQVWELVVGDDFLAAPGAAPHTFSSSLPVNPATNYLILTSRRLRGPGVDALATYRRSAAGGGYLVSVVEVEDLYDEFAYGIPRHPMALRNYLYAAQRAAPQLQYLFLIGKGREYKDLRTPAALADAAETFFLPSFGFPASDHLLAADIGSVVPSLAVGRLAAINDGEVALYAKKLRDVEEQINQGDQTIADRDWMKQIMHLGGGTSPGEQSSIKSGLSTMESSIRTSAMGANVVSFFKTSSEPIEDSRQDAIFDRINAGTSIITFFGHSSSQTFDFSIDDPDNYFNFGKYPYMMSLGCYSGDAFTKERSISERFLFLRDKGAIAFAASKGVGYISALSDWGEVFYASLGNGNYGKGIGDAMRATIERYSNTTNFTLGILTEQFALNGDPAYRLHPRPGPDFVVDPATITFSPEVVPAQDERFTISFELVNLGNKADQDSLTLRFRQELPTGEIVDLTTRRVATPAYRRQVDFDLPSVGFAAVGQNRVLVTVDSDQEITELPQPAAENNNEVKIGGRAGAPLTFIANTARVAFPPPFATVGGPLELVASTTNALAPPRDYLIQVARDRLYTDLISSEKVNLPGGVIRYQPNFPPVDSMTYYWRISPDSSFTEGAGFLWSESSFTWLQDQRPDEIGWAVQHEGQTIDGNFANILADTTQFGWNSARNVTDIKIFNALHQDASMPRLEYNGQQFSSPFRFYIKAGIQLLVIDTTNNLNWFGNPGNGDYNTRPIRDSSWDFDTRTKAGREGLIQFITEAIEPGKYVLLYSVQKGNDVAYYNDDWLTDETDLGTTVFDVLEAEGALQIRRLAEAGSVPYVFVFQKGRGPISEVMAQEQSDTILMSTSILENWPESEWVSPAAGPALAWDKVNLSLSSLNLTEADSVRFKIIGITPGGQEEELKNLPYNFRNSLDFRMSLIDIDAAQYPYLKVGFDFLDDDARTTPTVRYVYLEHSAPGDAAINAQVAYASPDSIEQGQPVELVAGYENVSRIGMDSLLIELTVVDGLNETTVLQQRRPPLPAGGTDQFSFTIPTNEVAGNLRYNVTLNPRQDQPENVLFNNVLTANVKIGQDVIAPDLQVFFDGRRINDGDLVSGKPEIHVQLRDDNRFLVLNDTSAYFLELTAPDGSRERLSFTDDRIEFFPATTAENTAEIYFRPTLAQNGTYALEVRGQDRSQNAAGRLSFRQEFEVINEQMVANVLTYPNPFTTQTRFVYTLTGNEVPEMFRIQIMTVAGRVVRDIDLLAYEDLKIGTHQTNFAWDGTDEYGDQLANGVYLYRVITADGSGTELDKYDTGTDQFFARNLGKVVILR